MSPGGDKSSSTVAHKAAKLGVAWVLLNRWSEQLVELRNEFPQIPISSGQPRFIRIGRIQARQFKILLPEGGEVFYLQGPYGTSFSPIEELEGAGRAAVESPIKLVPFNSDWFIDGGERTVRTVEIFYGREPVASSERKTTTWRWALAWR